MTVGFSVCGSFCSHAKALGVLRELVGAGYRVVPILSFNAAQTDTRFGRASDLLLEIESLCGRKAILSIEEAEPLGPKTPLDAMLICPCTGNTLAKLAGGITDTPVTMAAKAHLRADRPLVIALASNDALSANLANIGTLLNRKNVYFVPMREDDPAGKPHSLVADFSRSSDALRAAIDGRQLHPIFST